MDFRYHLVSIIAVFLALAIGIVVGTTALNGYVVDDLRARNGAVIRDKRSLEGVVRDLRSQVSRRDQFATAVAPEVVAGELSGERVVIVSTPGASDALVKNLSDLVARAGGTPTGVLQLKADLLDPAKSAVVDDVVAGVAPAGLALPEGVVADRAALELAAAILSVPAVDGISPDAAAKVLGGFSAADLVDVSAPAGSKGTTALLPATLALVVTGGPDKQPLGDADKQRQQAELAVLRALDARGSGAVLVGPESAAESGGLIDAARRSGDIGDRISSVDSADTSFGAVSVILALHEQAAGRSGRYGQGPGSQAAAPNLSTR